MTSSFYKHTLKFKQPSGTSRGVLKTKETWILSIEEKKLKGVGECGIFRGLSIDDRPDFEDKLQWACDNINLGLDTLLSQLTEFPSIQFGLEMAFLDLTTATENMYYPSKFTQAKDDITINGLVWMGSVEFMSQQIREKIESGFKCIKMKIGAIDFKSEIELLQSIRQEFSENDIELRVDANGAFKPEDALSRLNQLSKLKIHSIEQPIKQGQWEEMARLCENSPLPIALDEELIGILSIPEKEKLLKQIKPHYIILKPTLIGGYKSSEEWITLAEKEKVGWWITSALESNIGLNAIAQWTYTLGNSMPQGLGTGSLFTNNFESPLFVKNGTLRYEKQN